MNTSFSFEDEIDLSRFNTLYKTEAPSDAAPVLHTVPDGRYEVVVAEATLTKSQRSGNPMIRYVLRITGATFRDRIIRKHSAITENTIRFVRKELEVCGMQLARFEDLKSRIHELDGVQLEIDGGGLHKLAWARVSPGVLEIRELGLDGVGDVGVEGRQVDLWGVAHLRSKMLRGWTLPPRAA